MSWNRPLEEEEEEEEESYMWNFAKVAFTGAVVIGSGVLIYNSYNKKRDIPAARIPAKPKRPLTSYFQFDSEQRPKIVRRYPKMSMTDVPKMLGKMWRDMPVHQKDVYKRDFDARREKYVQEMELYRSRFTEEELASMDEQKREKRQKRAKRRHKSELKKLNKPKRPPTGYCLFIKACFDQQNAEGITREDDQFKKAAAAWKSLPEDDKWDYNEEASLLMYTYREEMEEWQREMEEWQRKKEEEEGI